MGEMGERGDKEMGGQGDGEVKKIFICSGSKMLPIYTSNAPCPMPYAQSPMPKLINNDYQLCGDALRLMHLPGQLVRF